MPLYIPRDGSKLPAAVLLGIATEDGMVIATAPAAFVRRVPAVIPAGELLHVADTEGPPRLVDAMEWLKIHDRTLAHGP